MRKLLISILTGASLTLAGCSTDKIPGVYRIDVQQGNVISEAMLAQLKPGMERRKVRYILGTPMIRDPFRKDRWDYLYSFQAGNEVRQQRRITVFFENDRLDRIEGDIVPESGKPLLTEDLPKRMVVTPPKERGFIKRLLDKVTGKDEK